MRTNLGITLRNKRFKDGHSIRELAPFIGISFGFLSEIERGDKLPSVQLLKKLSDVYRYPLEHLKYDYFQDRVDKLSQELSNDLGIKIKLSINRPTNKKK